MDFTNDEKHRIDVLYGTDFKDVTPDDISLIRRYEQYKAVEDAKMQAELQALKKKTEKDVAENTKTAELARSILSEKADRARARWEVLRYGK